MESNFPLRCNKLFYIKYILLLTGLLMCPTWRNNTWLLSGRCRTGRQDTFKKLAINHLNFTGQNTYITSHGLCVFHANSEKETEGMWSGLLLQFASQSKRSSPVRVSNTAAIQQVISPQQTNSSQKECKREVIREENV